MQMENHPHRTQKSIAARIILWTLSALVILILIGWVAFQVSPWPAAMLIRKSFRENGTEMSLALQKHVPEGVAEILNEHYDESDEDAFLDVYYPSGIANTEKILPTIIWIHGGGWLAGSKDEVANYCRILASRGYTVVAIDYTLAPGKHYPFQLNQINKAFGWLKKMRGDYILIRKKFFWEVILQVRNLRRNLQS